MSGDTVRVRDQDELTEYATRISPKRRLLTTVAVATGMLLASLDGTIIATAMPTAIGDLGGIDRYAWVFSIYLLAEIATIPLWGRLSDMYGRKLIYLSGMFIFLLGSVMCGMAGSMTQLIIFRGVQGIGAGCLLPVSQTIVADLYTMKQRPKVSAIFSSMFGVSSIVGPLLGGLITENLSWRWVFLVNIPVAVTAFVFIKIVMVEPLQHRHKHRLDWIGLFTLLGWTSLLVFALETGGRDYPWGSPVVVGALVGSVTLLVVFVWVERRVREPLIPLDLFKEKVQRAANVISLTTGVTMFGVLSFIPLFGQVVLGVSATGAGSLLTPMMLAMIGGSQTGARLVMRVGFRILLFCGFCVLASGVILLTTLGLGSTQLDTVLPMVLIGFGMGMTFITTTLSAQNSTATDRMGLATSMVNFTRQLGGALGVAGATAVMLSVLSSRLADAFPGPKINAGSLLAPQAASRFPAASQDLVRAAFADSLHLVFVAVSVIAVLGIFVTLLMPRGKPLASDGASLVTDDAILPDGETFVIVEPFDEPDSPDRPVAPDSLGRPRPVSDSRAPSQH